MFYYVGSQLRIEWTAQHSCGHENNQCQIILQYMCDDTAPGLRDGTPSNAQDSATERIDKDNKDNPRYGSHEPYEYYRKCEIRQRNTRLYIADRNIPQNAPATRTRQNENGDRYGWECPEEREYYPYWHPSPWKDIAILTTNTSDCPFYQANSQNVVGKGECWSKDGNEVRFFSNLTVYSI